jgi:hypothetical protein
MTDITDSIKLVADDTKAAMQKVAHRAEEAGTAAAAKLHEIAKKVDDKVTEVAKKATS